MFIMVKKGVVKQKITSDYVLDLYDKCKRLKNKKKKIELMKQIKKMSKHIGEYLIKIED